MNKKVFGMITVLSLLLLSTMVSLASAANRGNEQLMGAPGYWAVNMEDSSQISVYADFMVYSR